MNRFISIAAGLMIAAGTCFAEEAALKSPPIPQWAPGEGWKLEWSDEFDGSALNHKYWVAELGSEKDGWGNHELENYTEDPENIYLKDGKLFIRAIYKGGGTEGLNFTSARIKTEGKISFLYGKIAARMKLVKGQGLWPAFWMLGDNIEKVSWPDCGEIDIMEAGKDGDFSKVGGTIHLRDWRKEWTFLTGEERVLGGSVADDYHVYEVEWNPQLVIWRVDGDEYHRQRITDADMAPFHKPFFILLNLAVGGKDTTYTGRGSVPDLTAFPAEMAVDWVRVYKQSERK